MVDLSIVVPAYNEESRIEPTLLSTLQYFYDIRMAVEIIVVDDGSTDKTGSLVRTLGKLHPQLQLLSLEHNCGKGEAVRRGVLASKGKLILFMDADGSTPITEITRLLTNKGTHEHFVVIGSRAKHSPETSVTTNAHRKILGRAFNALVNLFLVPNVQDTQCGFKLFSKKAATFLFSKSEATGFSFDIEILHLAQRCNIPIIEVPVNWSNVAGSKVHLICDSSRMFLDIFRFRLRHRDINEKYWQEYASN